VRWCDLALVKSGTVTMQVAKQVRPMVIFYKKSNPLFFLLARSVLATKMFSLPNVIAGKRIVPELVPHWGGPKRIVDEAVRIIDDAEHAEGQRGAIREMLRKFEGMRTASLAADAILEMAGLEKAPGAQASQRPPSSRSTSPVM
jgi:lipid-A-disaccharide synthase